MGSSDKLLSIWRASTDPLQVILQRLTMMMSQKILILLAYSLMFCSFHFYLLGFLLIFAFSKFVSHFLLLDQN